MSLQYTLTVDQAEIERVVREAFPEISIGKTLEQRAEDLIHRLNSAHAKAQARYGRAIVNIRNQFAVRIANTAALNTLYTSRVLRARTLAGGGIRTRSRVLQQGTIRGQLAGTTRPVTQTRVLSSDIQPNLAGRVSTFAARRAVPRFGTALGIRGSGGFRGSSGRNVGWRVAGFRAAFASYALRRSMAASGLRVGLLGARGAVSGTNSLRSRVSLRNAVRRVRRYQRQIRRLRNLAKAHIVAYTIAKALYEFIIGQIVLIISALSLQTILLDLYGSLLDECPVRSGYMQSTINYVVHDPLEFAFVSVGADYAVYTNGRTNWADRALDSAHFNPLIAFVDIEEF